MKQRINRQHGGFTIVELLLALTFFSFILIFFSYGFIQINRTFQRGQTIKRVTQSGRSVMEDVTRNVRASGGQNGYELLQIDGGAGGATVNRLCLSNGIDYGWSEADETPDTLITPSGPREYQLVKSEVERSVCSADFEEFQTPQVVNAGSSNEYKTPGITSLLDDDMVVQNFEITEIAGGSALRIDLSLSLDTVGSLSGTGNAATCDGFIGNGDEFCDVVRFSTIVGFRL